MKKRNFNGNYGPWALVAGGSDGLGRAFSLELARRGLNLVIVGRRVELLRQISGEIRRRYPVKVRIVAADLSSERSRARLMQSTDDREIGLMVYNAALSPIGRFIDVDSDRLRETIETNCSGPLELARHYASLMAVRGRGGVILMSSMTAFQGTPLVAAYGATKAFNLILAEGIARELAPRGVDVLACAAGATLTPNYIQSKKRPSLKPGAGALEMSPEQVVREALTSLGKRSIIIPGRLNRFFHFIMTRLVSRKQAVRLIATNTEKLLAGGP
jgi:short-subunit dehydrogenase